MIAVDKHHDVLDKLLAVNRCLAAIDAKARFPRARVISTSLVVYVDRALPGVWSAVYRHVAALHSKPVLYGLFTT